MKKITFRLIFVIIISLIVVLSRFFLAPQDARLLLAANANCLHSREYSKGVLYRIDYYYAKIYREYLLIFGTEDLTDNGELTLAFINNTKFPANSSSPECKESKVELFEKLIKLGCNINQVGIAGTDRNGPKWSLLHIAIMKNDVQLVEFLLNHKANPLLFAGTTTTTTDGVTPIKLAMFLKTKRPSQQMDQIYDLLKTKEKG